MGENVKVYNIAGVQLVKSEPHMADNELRQGQNAVFGDDELGGGIETRPGMEKFNSVAMAGAVLGFINVGLTDTRPPEVAFQIDPTATDDGPNDTGTPPAVTTLTGATYHAALADENDATLMEVAIPTTSEGTAKSELTLELGPDPGTVLTNTGHSFTIRLGFDDAVGNDFTCTVLFVGTSVSKSVPVIDGSGLGTIDQYNVDLLTTDVDDLLANSWFDTRLVMIRIQSANNDAEVVEVTKFFYTRVL